ncbi:MAG: tyrosine-type recombinase/integrase [Rubripirellula sp.]
MGKFRNAKNRLIEYFGDIKLDQVTAGDADEYSKWLLEKLASATANKECQIAKQFFEHAKRKKMISANPFSGVTVGSSTNDERRRFITRGEINQVLDTCPNWQWRTVVALARHGGLRCSSEIALLKWSDIHWDKDRFTVTSPKTKRYGKATRLVPIFPELRKYLDEAFAMASEGEKWVVPMLEGRPNKNLGTTFNKILKRSGVEPWPKPFQNLRSSRQTELEENYPTHVVCSWLGNSPSVAQKHYLTVTEDHFNSASGIGDKLGMQTPVSASKKLQKKTHISLEVQENVSFSSLVGILNDARVAAEGLEPPTRGL